jgi:hypothetical protein
VLKLGVYDLVQSWQNGGTKSAKLFAVDEDDELQQ